MSRSKTVLTVASAGALVALCGGISFYLTALRKAPSTSTAANSSAQSVGNSGLLAKAGAGESEEQLKLGLKSLEGTEHPPDYPAALKWFQQAAEAGNAQAQFLLGTLYQTGRGVPRDYTNALFWFEKAASQNQVEALYNLGSLYASGRGVAQDSEKAAQYYRQAAELGDSYAQYNIAQRWELGRGVSTNFVEAWKWYHLAALGGVADAREAKRSLETRMTAAQLLEAREGAAAFLKQSAARKK